MRAARNWSRTSWRKPNRACRWRSRRPVFAPDRLDSKSGFPGKRLKARELADPARELDTGTLDAPPYQPTDAERRRDSQDAAPGSEGANTQLQHQEVTEIQAVGNAPEPLRDGRLEQPVSKRNVREGRTDHKQAENGDLRNDQSDENGRGRAHYSTNFIGAAPYDQRHERHRPHLEKQRPHRRIDRGLVVGPDQRIPKELRPDRAHAGNDVSCGQTQRIDRP